MFPVILLSVTWGSGLDQLLCVTAKLLAIFPWPAPTFDVLSSLSVPLPYFDVSSNCLGITVSHTRSFYTKSDQLMDHYDKVERWHTWYVTMGYRRAKAQLNSGLLLFMFSAQKPVKLNSNTRTQQWRCFKRCSPYIFIVSCPATPTSQRETSGEQKSNFLGFNYCPKSGRTNEIARSVIVT